MPLSFRTRMSGAVVIGRGGEDKVSETLLACNVGASEACLALRSMSDALDTCFRRMGCATESLNALLCAIFEPPSLAPVSAPLWLESRELLGEPRDGVSMLTRDSRLKRESIDGLEVRLELEVFERCE